MATYWMTRYWDPRGGDRILGGSYYPDLEAMERAMDEIRLEVDKNNLKIVSMMPLTASIRRGADYGTFTCGVVVMVQDEKPPKMT